MNCEFVVRQSIEYIRQHLEEELSIQKVAQNSGYSASWIEKNFIKFTGEGIFAHIQRLRIDKAKQLLRETSLSVSEIAYEVGYNSHARFTLAFVRLTGMPPSRYRKTALDDLAQGEQQ